MNIQEILREVDNADKVTKLYFTMKNKEKFISYSPSLGDEIQFYLTNVIKEKLSKFLNTEQLEYNPVELKDGIVEEYEVSKIANFENLIESFNEENVHRDIDHEDVKKCNFYCFKISFNNSSNDNDIIFIRSIKKFREIQKTGFIGTIKRNSFNKINDKLIGFDNNIDLIIYKGEVLIISHYSFEKVFDVYTFIHKETSKIFDKIGKEDKIINFESFKEDCLKDKKFVNSIRKLTPETIKERIGNFENIKRVIERFNLSLTINEKLKKIEYKSIEDKKDFLKILGDKFLKSYLTNKDVEI